MRELQSGLYRQFSVVYCSLNFTRATFAKTRATKNCLGCLNGRYGTAVDNAM